MAKPATTKDGSTFTFETGHGDTVHDAQLDFYGKRLATASHDGTAKIFDITDTGSYALVDTLRRHAGPVWAVAWAHPTFGNVIASCSFDGKALVWRQQANGNWDVQKEHSLHSASVNSISWAPHEFGSILACASTDGKASILTFNADGTCEASLIPAHPTGVNSISWAPAIVPGSLASNQAPDQTEGAPLKRFVTGGSDGLVKIWRWNDASKVWEVSETINSHTEWVRDVCWAPGVGLPRSYIATCGQDKKVFIHTQEKTTESWVSIELPGNFEDSVWRVSWNDTGNVLAVSYGKDKVSLYKENLQNKWECVSDAN